MDGIKNRGIYYLFSLLLGILLGMLLGATAMNTLVSYRIEEYYEQIRRLETTIEDKDIRLKKLEESINKRRFILKNIELVLIYEGDDIDKITLEKSIKEKYNKLLGKEVKTIDVDLLAEIIDGRIMKIESKTYKLKVDKIVLSEILKIWVQINILDE